MSEPDKYDTYHSHFERVRAHYAHAIGEGIDPYTGETL